MPATRSRISSSSSTMRISDAISDPFLLIFTSFYVGGLFCPFDGLLTEGEGERDFRPSPAFAPTLGIGEDDVPAMVFHDLAHDREPQPGALGARGDIGLGEPMAMLRRQADAIVGNADGEGGIARRQREGDAAGFVLTPGNARGDALARILQHI